MKTMSGVLIYFIFIFILSFGGWGKIKVLTSLSELVFFFVIARNYFNSKVLSPCRECRATRAINFSGSFREGNDG